MVKARPRDVPSLTEKLPDGVRAVLVFGKDEGLIRERRDQIARQIAPDPADPFSVSAPDAERILDDPALLADEMGAVSMTGGRRLVRIDDASDRLTDAVRNALTLKTGDALLLLAAGDLGPRSPLRKYFEQAPDALALPCYPDSEQDITALIRQAFREGRVAPGEGVADYLAQRLGNDRQVTRAELEKIVLYAGGGAEDAPQSISLEEVRLLTGDASELTLGRLVAAATGPDASRLARLLERAREQGIGAIEVLRALQLRLQQMHLVRGLMEEGMPLGEALSKLRPPLFFKDRDVFAAQIKNWKKPRLNAALAVALEAETACKATGAPDFSLAAQTCLKLCAGAAAAARQN